MIYKQKLNVKKWFLLISYIIFLSQQITKGQQVINPQNITTQLNDFLQMANRFYQFNGSAIISYRGTILLNKGYGFKNVAGSEINDSGTIFQIGSVTKEFTSTVILLLKEQGRLSLQDKLSDYFPGYPNSDKITIRQLLTHTSGIYNYTSDLEREDSAVICHPVSKDRIVQQFINQPLDFTPGTKYNYSNSGYFLLGMIIEKVTGKPWEENVREQILTPLGMQHTGFNFNGLKSADKAQGYQFFNEEHQQPDISWDSTVSYAAGSVYSTTKDMLTWARAVTDKKILSADCWKEALTANQHGYGYGWEIDTVYGHKAIGHNGGIPGFSSQMLLIPDQDLEIIVLTNVHENSQVTPISRILAAITMGKPYSGFQPKDYVSIQPEALAQYVGSYRQDKDHVVNVLIKNGKLYIEAISNRLPLTRLYPDKSGGFFVANITLEIELRFIKNKTGKVMNLIAIQNGKEYEWKKFR